MNNVKFMHALGTVILKVIQRFLWNINVLTKQFIFYPTKNNCYYSQVYSQEVDLKPSVKDKLSRIVNGSLLKHFATELRRSSS